MIFQLNWLQLTSLPPQYTFTTELKQFPINQEKKPNDRSISTGHCQRLIQDFAFGKQKITLPHESNQYIHKKDVKI